MTEEDFELAVELGHTDQVRHFLESGIDPTGGLTSTLARFDRDMLQLLLDYGADVHQLDDINQYHDDPLRVPDKTLGQPAIFAYIDALLENGWRLEDLDPFEREQIRFVTGAAKAPKQSLTAIDGLKTADQVTGRTNPQEVTSDYHRQMIRTGYSTFEARSKCAGRLPHGSWTAHRFGQSTTRLPDGRWIQIAGEHEDYYDPDFMIFNDVIIHDGHGNARVLLYPRADFMSTDFHSASLVGDTIWIIGNLGYVSQRQPEKTPVYVLSLDDLSIAEIQTSGDQPGWISHHTARVSDSGIIISAGKRWTGHSLVEQPDTYLLDTTTRHWTKSV